MRKHTYFLLAGGMLAALTVGLLSGQQPVEKAAPQAKSTTAADPEHAADAAAIKQGVQSFIKAFKSGDAKAVAAHWTENGEYVADDGTTFRGRNAIEKAYAESFSKTKGPSDADTEVVTIRFPSRDTAIEEGYFKVRRGNGAPVTSKYTVLHVREAGKWLMAVVREWPSEGMALRDLEWLIGTWVAKREDTEVRTTYSWWGDKSYIRADITIKRKDGTSEGFQMIGKDASTGTIHSWTFDRDGSFGEATWSREGRKWHVETTGVAEDGSRLTATNIISPIDTDTFTFQSVNRTEDGEDVADIPPVRVTRVK